MDDCRKISSCSLYSSDHNLYSQESILFALNRFLKSIANMNDTVLVPCKLHDVVDDDQDEKSLTSLSSDDGLSSGALSANLYDNYQMLNEAKEEILWGNNIKQSSNEDCEASPAFQLKYHIQHLQQLLNQFSDVANSITTKYQSETGSM